MPGQGKHSDKWDRCVQQLKDKGGVYNPYGVCTSSVGECECGNLPFQQVFIHKKREGISGSSMPQLTRSDVQDINIK